jgi:hypothetical protein
VSPTQGSATQLKNVSQEGVSNSLVYPAYHASPLCASSRLSLVLTWRHKFLDFNKYKKNFRVHVTLDPRGDESHMAMWQSDMVVVESTWWDRMWDRWYPRGSGKGVGFTSRGTHDATWWWDPVGHMAVGLSGRVAGHVGVGVVVVRSTWWDRKWDRWYPPGSGKGTGSTSCGAHVAVRLWVHMATWLWDPHVRLTPSRGPCGSRLVLFYSNCFVISFLVWSLLSHVQKRNN